MMKLGKEKLTRCSQELRDANYCSSLFFTNIIKISNGRETRTKNKYWDLPEKEQRIEYKYWNARTTSTSDISRPRKKNWVNYGVKCKYEEEIETRSDSNIMRIMGIMLCCFDIPTVTTRDFFLYINCYLETKQRAECWTTTKDWFAPKSHDIVNVIWYH